MPTVEARWHEAEPAEGEGAPAAREPHAGPVSRSAVRVDDPPAAVVRRWVRAIRAGRMSVLLPLYSPRAIVHSDGHTYRGRPAVRRYLLASGLLGREWGRMRERQGMVVVERWSDDGESDRQVRTRVLHGRIVEQWAEGGPEGPDSM